ncbi:MAG: DEAD/DEAH box helicase [Bacteroidaceae bacterium]|nr:DEAD/DEAH box helicase [Bacteroidaceae bacterium]
MYFDEFDFEDEVLDALDSMNFVKCTPIQEQTLEPLMAGRDLIGVAQTGTGKTAAYLLPVLNRLCSGEYPEDAINCIIMAPTRELAQQIDRQLEGFTYFMQVSSVAVYGGNDGQRYEQELRGMSKGADIIVATPGRLISHINLGNVDLSKVSFFILDEADRMLDMGFCNDIMTIAKQLPKERQTMLFSATMPEEIRRLAKEILNDPVQITLALAKPAEGITQQAYVCYEGQKMGIINKIFDTESSERVILFASRKTKVKEIARALRKHGFNVGEMHSDLSQSERDEIMFQYKSRKIDMIVATDILARGIDIDDIRIVINFDVPRDCDDYIHRIGRTARAGSKGRAITFVSEDDQEFFGRIEEFIEQNVTKMEVPSELGDAPAYEPKKRKEKPRQGRGRGKVEKKKGSGNSTGGEKEKREKMDDSKSRKRNSRRRKASSAPKEPKEKPVDSVESPKQPNETTQDANKEKKRRNNRRRYRKPQKKENGNAQETPKE